MKLSPFAFALVLFATLTFQPAGAADEYQPKIAEASRDAELALEGFVIPDAMEGRLLAAEPGIANPVAFCITDDGRVLVCETFRQEEGVEDNRSHMNWLETDLRLESVEERVAMFRRFLGEEADSYGVHHDRIRLLTDSNGDGTLDQSKVFADGFNDIAAGTGAGVIEVDGSILYTCIPDLWVLEDTDGDGKADSRRSLHSGYGVRVAFRGHDMHGLTRGPDGRIYYSIGDRGYNVISPEGKRLKRVDTGAVFRCFPDGSHLEVFAYGLRNPQELAFDDAGNLFTGDNNSDSGDQARWVYVVRDGDTGWRMYFQYLQDRGPWNRERMWYPYRDSAETTAVQPAYIVPPVANLGDGPSGLTYYPGVGLEDRYQGHFFMADFRGGSANSGIRSFAVEKNGATWNLVDSHQFLWSILATDVDFAPNGSLYVSDWVNGWVGEGRGRLYEFSDPQHTSSESAARLAADYSSFSVDELGDLMKNADRRVRLKAQYEVASRGEKKALQTWMRLPTDPMLVRHSIWGLWQIGLQSKDQGKEVVLAFARYLKEHPNSGNQADQVLRVMADLLRHHSLYFSQPDSAALLRSVAADYSASDDLRVRGFAALLTGECGTGEDAQGLLRMLDENDNADPVVRHQASFALSRIAARTPGLLASLRKHPGDAGRLGLVLAMRRNEDASIVAMLQDADEAVATEAARAISDEQATFGIAPLADLIDRPGLSAPLLRRAMEACVRIGTADRAAQVAAVAADGSQDDSLRVLAAELLRDWNEPKNTDSVTGRWRPVPARRVPGLNEAISPALPGMLAGGDRLRETAVDLAGQLGITDIQPQLSTLFYDSAAVASLRVSSLRALVRLAEDPGEYLKDAAADSAEAVRLAALELSVERNPRSAVDAVWKALQADSAAAKQKALQLVSRLSPEDARPILRAAFDQLKSGQLPAAVHLDLLEAAESVGGAGLKGFVADFREDQQQAGSVVGLWSECLEGGDARRGESIFFGRDAASCRRCHKVNGSGGNVGPDLSEIAKDKDRTYLLQSIVNPNAKIAKGFETTVIVTVDGKVLSGIKRAETEEVVQLMTPQGAVLSVPVEDIEERAVGQSGMPADITKNLSRRDVRDLVEYLAELKERQGGEHGE